MWKPTNNLRWFRYRISDFINPVLQQEWEYYEKGVFIRKEWFAVPDIEEDSEEEDTGNL